MDDNQVKLTLMLWTLFPKFPLCCFPRGRIELECLQNWVLHYVTYTWTRSDPCMHVFSEEVRGEDLEPHSWGSAGS